MINALSVNLARRYFIEESMHRGESLQYNSCNYFTLAPKSYLINLSVAVSLVILALVSIAGNELPSTSTCSCSYCSLVYLLNV